MRHGKSHASHLNGHEGRGRVRKSNFSPIEKRSQNVAASKERVRNDLTALLPSTTVKHLGIRASPSDAGFSVEAWPRLADECATSSTASVLFSTCRPVGDRLLGEATPGCKGWLEPRTASPLFRQSRRQRLSGSSTGVRKSDELPACNETLLPPGPVIRRSTPHFG